MDDLELYLDVLFDGLDGYVYSPVKTTESWESNWFLYPEQRSDLKAHIQAGRGDVYISPAVYSERRATKDYIKNLQTVWVEFDGADRIDFREIAKPTLIVQTSFESHVHCYWRTDQISMTAVENVNRRLTHYLHADSSGWDATQLLRPPSTINHKHGLPVILSHSSNKEFPIEQFDFVPQVPAPSYTEPIQLGQLLTFKDITHQLPLKLIKMVKKEEPVEPYRSSFLFRLSNELAEEGLKYVEIVSLLKIADDRIGKYAGRNDQLIRLSQLADFAIHKHIADEEIIIWTPQQILDYVDDLHWIIPGWLHTTGQLVLSSAPGVGKTQMLMQMAYCLESQSRFLGFLAPNPHKVFFLSLEMDKTGLKYILSHQRNEWTKTPTFWIQDEATSLVGYENKIAELEPTVLMVDSATELFDENMENPNIDTMRLMRWCRKIRRRYGLALVLIHHNRKATEGNKKPKSLADLAGSFYFGKDSDTVLQLWRDANGKLELSSVKSRYAADVAFPLTRNEHLWFTRTDNAGNGEEPTKPDTGGNPPEPTSGSGHGNELHQFLPGTLDFRGFGKDGQ